MPWNNKLHGGFSRVEPWLPVSDEHRAINVEKQEADQNSVLHFYRKIIAFRRAHPALLKGDIQLLPSPNSVLAFRRSYDEETLLCLFNMDVIEYTITCEPTEILLGQNAVIDLLGVNLGVCGFCIMPCT
jgi:alpha-glucosidase